MNPSAPAALTAKPRVNAEVPSVTFVFVAYILFPPTGHAQCGFVFANPMRRPERTETLSAVQDRQCSGGGILGPRASLFNTGSSILV